LKPTELMAHFLGEKAEARTAAHVKELAGQWDRLGPMLRGLLPQVEPQKADLFWHLGILELVEARSKACKHCDPSRWVYHAPEDAPQEQRSCRSPLHPVVTRTGDRPHPEATVGKLRLSWLPCTVYREWAQDQKQQRASRSRPVRKWGGSGR
jgi:hypothetical protein